MLDSHASRSRSKLNRSPETAYILNVWNGFLLRDASYTRRLRFGLR